MSRVKLVDVCEIIMGQSPPGSSYSESGNGVPLLNGAADIKSDGLTPKKWTTAPTRTCRQGDAVLCIRATIGRTTPADGEYCLGRGVAALRPNHKIDLSYLIRVVENNLQQLDRFLSGSTIKGIRREHLEQIEFDLPSVEEQKRITAILDKTDEIKQASDKTEDIRGKFANAIFLDIFGDPVLNTKNWNTLPMTEIFEIITGKLDSNAAVEGGEYPFFTCAKEASQIDHFAFDCECLLLAGNNASGDFDVKYYNGKFNAYQRTYILTTDKIEYDYARFALDYQLKKLKQSSLGTNTRYLTMGIFKRMHIQIPSRDLQKQFSLYYNALRNSAERDRIKVDELLKSTESLILLKH